MPDNSKLVPCSYCSKPTAWKFFNGFRWIYRCWDCKLARKGDNEHTLRQQLKQQRETTANTTFDWEVKQGKFKWDKEYEIHYSTKDEGD